MTQKELLYLKDAIGHEENIRKICIDMIDRLENEELKNFLEAEVNNHITRKEELLSLLEEKAHE